MGNQIQIANDPQTGHIVIAFGPQAQVTMSPKDALSLMAGMATVLSQHPQIQPQPEPKILVANCMPRVSGGFDLQ